MNILVTGASGFLGSALIPKLISQGHKVYGLSRHPPIGSRHLIPIIGDITKPNLGLGEVPGDIEAIHHIAGIHSLGEDPAASIWNTNVDGTKNVLEFCLRHEVPRLYFTSTAYTWPFNTYGMSKIKNEEDIAVFAGKHGIKTTIFKPSIIMGTEEQPYLGHFSQFVSLVIKVHRRAESIRRKIEGTLRLPVLEPVFRIQGNAEGTLNLVTVDAVTEAMATISQEGIYWLTNPRPPTLTQTSEWISEFVLVKIKILPDFKPTPIEARFQKMTAAFEPYLQGDNFRSDLKECPPITREFIHDTIKRIFLD